VSETGAVNKFIDLTYAFNNETVTWPGRKSTFNVEIEGYTPDGVWIASKGFCTSEHTATHIDAPYHYNPVGRKLDQIPLEDLIDVQGVVIDIYDKVHQYKDGKLSVIENYALKREDVIEWEEKHGKIPPRAIVLIRSGWNLRWGNKKEYLNPKKEVPAADPNKAPEISLDVDLNFPAFSAEAAKFLTTERQVLGVGVDTISIDIGSNSRLFPAHQVFAARNVFMLEMVANLHLLPPTGFNLWAVPFKIDHGTGAPTRVLAKLHESPKAEAEL